MAELGKRKASEPLASQDGSSKRTKTAAEMEKLIPVINKLQDVILNALGHLRGGGGVSGENNTIKLPQIAVVGTQSSGKSSVMENLVGRDFLPRGNGIVTRRPLILQLVHTTPPEAESRWGWGQFLHTGETKYFQFSDIRSEIAAETDRVAGKNKGISAKPIRLRIFSPHVVDLTLIDLPGITRLPVGEQPKDIEKHVRTIIEKYTSNPKCIILAVHEANTDLATSEVLKLARQTDPEGKRTLAVCTKLDIMDDGTDATDLLTGKIIPVKLGIIGVVNRSQQDINNAKSIEDALRDEETFLQRRYPLLASKNGSKYLAQTLNRLLLQHIRDILPELKKEIRLMLSAYRTQLKELGEPTVDKGQALLDILPHFATRYCQRIEGSSRDVETSRLSGGAEICLIFHDTFSESVNSISPLDSLSRADIIQAIRNATGPRPALLVPEHAFEILMKRQIALLLPPSLNCVELVHGELQRIAGDCLSHAPTFRRFPTLREQIKSVVKELLEERLAPTNQMVENLIQIELAYINTNHPNFVGGARAASESYMDARTNGGEGDQGGGGSGRGGEQMILSRRPLKLTTSSDRVHSFSGLGIFSALSGLGFRRHTSDSPSQLPGNTTDTSSAAAELNVRCSPSAQSTSPGGSSTVNRIEFECELIEKLINSYFAIVQQTVQDLVPKMVMHSLVNYVKENLQRRLLNKLCRSELYDALLNESEETIVERREIVEKVAVFQQAVEILNEIRDHRLYID